MMILYFLFSYLTGSLMAGYFVVRFLGNKDIRKEGSGNVGARNAGRVHGKTSFVLTFLGDALKGALVVKVGGALGFTPELTLIGLGFAILGHLKPVTLNFKGGMGISTFIGGMLAFAPGSSLVMILGFLLLFPLTKSFTFSGLGSFSALPFFIYLSDRSVESTGLVGALVLVILFVHRHDIVAKINNRN